MINEFNWNSELAKFDGTHFLQSKDWGEFKQEYGWEVIQKVWRDEAGKILAMAQILKKKVSLGNIRLPYSILYLPRGPVMDFRDTHLFTRVVKDLMRIAKEEKAIQFKIEPELIVPQPLRNSIDAASDLSEGVKILLTNGWKLSDQNVQFKNTALLSLDGNETDWLARMKQKTRYNLRLSQRKGVLVQRTSTTDLRTFYQMYAETSLRDNFTIRNQAYYESVWNRFLAAGKASAFLATFEGKPIAGLILFHSAKRAWYVYGMSSNEHRDLMPNYLLQWEAMRYAKSLGCTEYDLWGAPDQLIETDPMWGVYRFKEGLGATPVFTSGSWDYTPYPLLYNLYTKILPGVLNWMRRRGKKQVQQSLAAD